MNGMGHFLETERLYFRHWRRTDAALALRLWGDTRVTQWIVAGDGLTPAAVRSRLNEEITCQQTNGMQYWPLFNQQTLAFVGCCGLRPYAPAANVLEIGVHICSSDWRRGYAFEAARAVIAYAFEHFHAQALFAGHNPDNEPSRRLLQKLGFTYTHDEYYAPTGRQHPSYRFFAADL